MQSKSTLKSITHLKYSNWQEELRNNFRNPEKLLKTIGLNNNDISYSEAGIKQFPLNVTQHFVAQIKYGDANDPLLRQIFPYQEESIETTGYTADPLNEISITQNGLMQKYHGRALFIMTGACAIHCRYCFRRHFPYNDLSCNQSDLQNLFMQVESDDSIEEIILSGGDPLLLGDNKLKEFISRLENIKHIKRLRIHSRLPIVLPSRVTPELINVLKDSRFKIVIVVHSNHANELSEDVRIASELLTEAGFKVFNQSVLLYKVNDSLCALKSLSEKLFEFNIQAYYLHLLDPVQNAAHYAVSETDAITLMRSLRENLPGYMLPQLVKELPGELNKTPINFG